MENKITIEKGKFGWILYIGGVRVNYSDCEFCTIPDLRNYWHRHRAMLLSGIRHTNLKDYLYS